MKKVLMILPALFLAGILFYACQDANVVETQFSQIRLYASVTPTFVPSWPPPGGAAAECAYGDNACGDFAYKWNEDPDGDGPPPLGYPKEGIPNGDITYEGNKITISGSDGKKFNFTSEYPVCKVIVKGGPGANIYYYDPVVYADNELVAPINPSNGKNYAISHVVFCFNEPDDLCWKDETAWAYGTRYEDPGNWATFTPYVAGSTVTLYAGQTWNAGTVHFSAVDEGEVTITITLGTGYKFWDVEENVKIQDYEAAPSGNPAPGGFDHKETATTSPFTIKVPSNNYYGVHVDVGRVIPCPPEE
jgi:hypothetical protein